MKIRTIVRHRVNTVAELNQTPKNFGVELDLRANGTDVILNHDPFEKGEIFENYLESYDHKLMILNTKTDGLEERLITLMGTQAKLDYFFLDTTIPTMVRLTKKGISKIAVRFSDYEPLEFVGKFAGKTEWVWVDCFTTNILTRESYNTLKRNFKICVVSPELQSHPSEWIQIFKSQFDGFELDAVCTKFPELWK